MLLFGGSELPGKNVSNLIVILITLEVEGKYKAGKKNVKCLPMDYYRALKENLMGNFTQNRINWHLKLFFKACCFGWGGEQQWMEGHNICPVIWESLLTHIVEAQMGVVLAPVPLSIVQWQVSHFYSLSSKSSTTC